MPMWLGIAGGPLCCAGANDAASRRGWSGARRCCAAGADPVHGGHARSGPRAAPRCPKRGKMARGLRVAEKAGPGGYWLFYVASVRAPLAHGQRPCPTRGCA